MVSAMVLQIAIIYSLRDEWKNFNPDYYWWPVGIAIGVAGNCLAWSWLKKAKAGEGTKHGSFGNTSQPTVGED